MLRHGRNIIGILGLAAFAVVFAAVGVFAGDGSPNATRGGFEYPAGSPATIARAFIDAFNSGDEDILADFCTTHESDDALAERSLKSQLYQFTGLCRMLGTLSPYDVVDHSQSKIVVLVRSDKLGTWFNVGVHTDENRPDKAAHVYVRPARPPEMIGRS